MIFTATMKGFIVDVINVTIPADNHLLAISLSPTMVGGEYMRLIMNWVNRQMNLDLHVTQIDKWVWKVIHKLLKLLQDHW